MGTNHLACHDLLPLMFVAECDLMLGIINQSDDRLMTQERNVKEFEVSEMTVAALVNEWQFVGKRIAIVCNGIGLCRCLMNTAIASASKPASMVSAMKKVLKQAAKLIE